MVGSSFVDLADEDVAVAHIERGPYMRDYESLYAEMRARFYQNTQGKINGEVPMVVQDVGAVVAVDKDSCYPIRH